MVLSACFSYIVADSKPITNKQTHHYSLVNKFHVGNKYNHLPLPFWNWGSTMARTFDLLLYFDLHITIYRIKTVITIVISSEGEKSLLLLAHVCQGTVSSQEGPLQEI